MDPDRYQVAMCTQVQNNETDKSYDPYDQQVLRGLWIFKCLKRDEIVKGNE